MNKISKCKFLDVYSDKHVATKLFLYLLDQPKKHKDIVINIEQKHGDGDGDAFDGTFCNKQCVYKLGNCFGLTCSNQTNTPWTQYEHNLDNMLSTPTS